MTPDQRAEWLFNRLLSLSVLSWALLGLWKAAPADRWAPVTLSVSTLHATVGVLFWRRARETTRAAPAAVLQALPALVLSGVAFKWAPRPSQWTVGLSACFVVGTMWTVWSLGTLGRSFAVLPSHRALVSTGPYRWIRHPAYLGELWLIQLVALAAWDPWAVVACAATVPLTMVRIQAEERGLHKDPAWAIYRLGTRWRLMPGIW